MYSLLAVPHPLPLVWLVIESNHFWYFLLVSYTVSSQFRLYMREHIEWFSVFTIPIWFFIIPCMMEPEICIVLSLPMIFFCLFIVIVGWVVLVHTIKAPAWTKYITWYFDINACFGPWFLFALPKDWEYFGGGILPCKFFSR